MSRANKITMVSDGDGEVGASRITQEVLTIMQSIPGVVTAMTGVDFLKKPSQVWNGSVIENEEKCCQKQRKGAQK